MRGRREKQHPRSVRSRVGASARTGHWALRRGGAGCRYGEAYCSDRGVKRVRTAEASGRTHTEGQHCHRDASQLRERVAAECKDGRGSRRRVQRVLCMGTGKRRNAKREREKRERRESYGTREPVIHRSEPRSEHVGPTSKPRPCPPAVTRHLLLHAGGKGKGIWTHGKQRERRARPCTGLARVERTASSFIDLGNGFSRLASDWLTTFPASFQTPPSVHPRRYMCTSCTLAGRRAGVILACSCSPTSNLRSLLQTLDRFARPSPSST